MRTTLRGLCFGILLMLSQNDEAQAFLSRAPLEMSVEIVVNPFEGSPRSGCDATEEIGSYSKKSWWVAVASSHLHQGTQQGSEERQQGSEERPEGADSGFRCGNDSYAAAQLGFEDVFGPAALVSEISTAAIVQRQMEDERVLSVKVSASIRRRSRSNEEEAPIYERSQVQREFLFPEDGEVFVPLLVADAVDSEAFGPREVFLRIAVRTVDDATGAHGTRSSSRIGGTTAALCCSSGCPTSATQRPAAAFCSWCAMRGSARQLQWSAQSKQTVSGQITNCIGVKAPRPVNEQRHRHLGRNLAVCTAVGYKVILICLEPDLTDGECLVATGSGRNCQRTSESRQCNWR